MNGEPVYHDQFEPWWPAHSQLAASDKLKARNVEKRRNPWRLVPLNEREILFHIELREASTVKITDTAIAHALRDAYRN